MTQIRPTGGIQTCCACASFSSTSTPMKRSITSITQVYLVPMNPSVSARARGARSNIRHTLWPCASAALVPALVGEGAARRAPGCLEIPEFDKQAPCPSLPSADIAAWEREPGHTMESAKLFIAVRKRLRVLASLTCPHPVVGREDSARQAACLWGEFYLPVQAGDNCGSELGRFHRALTVEAHTCQ
jgi:hypothetical protein